MTASLLPPQLGMVLMVLFGLIHWVVRFPASNTAIGRLMAGIGVLVTFSVNIAVMILVLLIEMKSLTGKALSMVATRW
ncbi:MAG TPA: hypothetical protein V6C95_14375 [Coleofasciculaceae cyanobacterium]